MKKLRRLAGRKLTAIKRGIRRRATAARVLLLIEIVAVGGLLSFLLTGTRAAMLDRAGTRADITATLIVLTLFGILHAIMSRRVLSVIEVRFFGERYDDRQILADLGYAARRVATLEELFKLVTDKIQHALNTENVSIFVRDDQTGDFICAMSSPHDAQQPLTLARNCFVARRLQRLATPLKVDEKDFDVWMRALDGATPSEKHARQQEIATLRRIKARMLSQIMMKDQLVGILSLGAHAGKREFSDEDSQMLVSIAGQMAFIIENAKLVQRMAEEERLKREVALAVEVQQRLFPQCPPQSNSLELSGFCQPAREVGGDYYDFLLLDDGQIGIAVADVAGKGISAALLMSIVQASLRSQATTHSQVIGIENPLAELASTMNRLMYRSTGDSSYATFFYAQFDEHTRRLTYVNAGHNPPLLVRTKFDQAVISQSATRKDSEMRACVVGRNATLATTAVRDSEVASEVRNEAQLIVEQPDQSPSHASLKLSTGGPAIGILDGCAYEQETIQMQQGDVLVAYTDGVTESLNTEDEEFGEARLQQVLTEAAHLSADEVSEKIKQRVRDWCGNAPQHDDLTFVVLKVK